jgi:hypothetical protein
MICVEAGFWMKRRDRSTAYKECPGNFDMVQCNGA